MRADFIANASHELRTPLAAVSGFIDTLRGHAKEDEVAREKFLDIMGVEAARMRRLIDDLLSLTRIEMNEHVPPEGRVALEGVVREAAAALEPLAAPTASRSTINSHAGLPPVIGDRDELVQLFQNLIHNAIKYGREDGHVWISLGNRQDGHGCRRGARRRRGHCRQRRAPPDRALLPGGRETQRAKGAAPGWGWPSSSTSSAATRAGSASKAGWARARTFTVLLPAAPAEIARENRKARRLSRKCYKIVA